MSGYSPLPNWFVRDIRPGALTLAQRVVWMVLSNHVAGRDGWAMSRACIGAEAGLSLSATKRALSELEAVGLISIENRNGGARKWARYFVADELPDALRNRSATEPVFDENRPAGEPVRRAEPAQQSTITGPLAAENRPASGPRIQVNPSRETPVGQTPMRASDFDELDVLEVGSPPSVVSAPAARADDDEQHDDSQGVSRPSDPSEPPATREQKAELAAFYRKSNGTDRIWPHQQQYLESLTAADAAAKIAEHYATGDRKWA